MNALIRIMVKHPVAANLLMIIMLALGLVSAMTITQKVMPEFDLGKIMVVVNYPGASPADIEVSVIQRIEEAIHGLENIHEVTSVASENKAKLIIELARDTDVNKKLDEVKAAIDRLTTLPKHAEKPVITALSNRRRIMQVIYYGDVSDANLREIAYKTKDDLRNKPGISFMQVMGVRDYEISLYVSQAKLRSYGLTLADIAQVIKQSSLDLPSGQIKTRKQRILLRVKGQHYRHRDFANIIVAEDKTGAKVYLRDIATIEDGFTESDLRSRYNDKPAVFLDIYRTGNEQVLETVKTVEHYLAHEIALPTGVKAHIWRNSAVELKSRLHLLMKSGFQGLLLVILLLAIFLDLRLALWVSAGIGVSFVGSFFFMKTLSIDIHQISLFGFIMAIGVVVDDAIVVAERIFRMRDQVDSPVTAAIVGAQKIAVPVVFSVLTTVIAFMALLYIPGVLGKFLFAIPAVVIIILLLSLVEALFILPFHLSKMGHSPRMPMWFMCIKRRACDVLDSFIDGPLMGLLTRVIARPKTTVLICVLSFILSLQLVIQGYIRISFSPQVASKYVTATIVLAEGTSAAATQQVADYVLSRGKAVAREIARQYEMEEVDVYKGVYLSLGQKQGGGDTPDKLTDQQYAQSHVASIQFELGGAEERHFSSKQFENRWREQTGDVADVQQLTFSSALIHVGDPIQVELSAPRYQDMMHAADALKQALLKFDGVSEVRDDQGSGQMEIELKLKPEARHYNLMLENVAQQLRAAFYGVQALQLQRGRDDVKIYVRLPQSERNSFLDLQGFQFRTEKGYLIPLTAVADLHQVKGPATIRRRHGRRTVTVTAQVNAQHNSAEQINQQLVQQILPALKRQHPGLHYAFAGEQRRKAEVVPTMWRNFFLSMLAIYVLIAVIFRSYWQPLLVMAAIPMGVVGAIVGHLIMGLPIGMLTVFGLVGLSGVIINNAIVLIDLYNRKVRQGLLSNQALLEAVQQRFRPIFLTSLTTFLGVSPLLIERSLQAQFLIPMAASIGFGILFGSVFVLMLIPALMSLFAKSPTNIEPN